jgi:tetratricopeptide (TPR) repeat protein
MIRLNDEFIPPNDDASDSDEITALTRLLQQGRPVEKQQALLKLVQAGAEPALTRCLAAPDPITVQLATVGLWECWLNEKGPEARRRMEEGIQLMDSGDLDGAQKIFQLLIARFPDWAEALNKQATLLYLRGLAGDSMELCRMVVEMKPNHFGAWNGLALCAVQMGAWETALNAAQKAYLLQPSAQANAEIIQLAQAKLGLC